MKEMPTVRLCPRGLAVVCTRYRVCSTCTQHQVTKKKTTKKRKTTPTAGKKKRGPGRPRKTT